MRVLWIDPGLKTGVCLFNADTLKVERFAIVDGGLKGFKSWWSGQNFTYDVLGCESFETMEGAHGIDVASPMEIIGWIKSWDEPVVWQRRTQRRKDKLTPTVLRKAGLYPKRGELWEGHQVAALQHALSYLIARKHHGVIELLYPKDQ